MPPFDRKTLSSTWSYPWRQAAIKESGCNRDHTEIPVGGNQYPVSSILCRPTKNLGKAGVGGTS